LARNFTGRDLTFSKCQGEMRIISFIDQPEVISTRYSAVG